MPNNWKTYKLGEVVNYVNGGAWPAKCYSEEGIPIVRVSDVSNGLVDLSACKYLDVNYGEKYLKHKLNEDDLIICTVGSHPDKQSSVVGGAGIVSEEVGGAYLNQNAVLLRSNDLGVLNQKWLGYLGKSIIFKNHIESEARGSANQVRIAISNLLNLRFNLPPLPEQTAIASILSALDDKIELNLQTNRTLEEMAMTLYKHWFVDFGPFQNGEFVDSELGMIPKGWEVKRLESISKIKGGKRLPKGKQLQSTPNNHPYLRVRDFNSSFLSEVGMEYVPNDVFNSISNYIVNTNDIILTIVGTIGRVALIGENLNEASLTENCIKISITNEEVVPELIYLQLTSLNGQDEIRSKTVGSTQPKLPIYNINSLKTVLPNDYGIIKSVKESFQDWFTMIYNNINENQTLTTLRDTLLPKLISGEVRVKEAEQMIKDM